MKAGRERKKDVEAEPKEPTTWSEFEVQAYLWSGLRDAGINARGEVKTRFSNRAYVRFDVAVFDEGELVGILEVKAASVAHKTSWKDTRQGQRYMQFDVPVRMVYGMDQARDAINDARNGRLWEVKKCEA